jgi:hypothetical protein
MLDYTLTAKERHQLKQDIAHRIHRAFDENGDFERHINRVRRRIRRENRKK